MASNVSIELIRKLASLPRETEWVEFKTSLPSGKIREGFERDVAAEHLSAGEVREVIDVDAFFVLTGLRQPSDGTGALEQLVAQGLLRSTDDGRYDVTNLGALLLARNLRAFPGLAMRPIRVVRFAGRGSQEILGHADFVKGYALSLREAETYLMSSIASHEERDGARRFVVYELPQPAVRELLTNAVIHQDLAYPYAGPFVGVHEGRIEFGNPGESLVAPEHVLNALPQERNKQLTTLLRLMGLCEASGTGWDLVVSACEAARLPAPKMRSDADQGTVVTLYGERPYERMKTSERLDATYWHACLRYAQDEELTNQSLRERFGERGHEPSSSAISRLIRLACERGLIKVSGAEASRKFRSYIPFWA